MGYPEKDQMSVGDFKRVHSFVNQLLENGYATAVNELSSTDVANTYFENGGKSGIVDAIQNNGLNQNVYYYDFGGKIYNQDTKSLAELNQFLKNSLPLAKSHHTFLSNKKALESAGLKGIVDVEILWGNDIFHNMEEVKASFGRYKFGKGSLLVENTGKGSKNDFSIIYRKGLSNGAI